MDISALNAEIHVGARCIPLWGKRGVFDASPVVFVIESLTTSGFLICLL